MSEEVVIKHLITADEFRKLARPTSTHLEDDEIMAFVDECEQMFIVPAIGYGNFKACVTDSPFDSTFDDTFKPVTLINGGEWKQKIKDCGCNSVKEVLEYCVGLKKTLSYFVYAKMARNDGSMVERAGFMRHNDQYGDHIGESQPKEKNKQYSDIMQIAEKYLADCMLYTKYHTCDKKIIPVRSSRARITPIGD